MVHRSQAKMSVPDSAKDVSVEQQAEDQSQLNTLHVVLCSPEQERLPEEAEPTQIYYIYFEEQGEVKEEHLEPLQSPEQPAGSVLTLVAVAHQEQNHGVEEDAASRSAEAELLSGLKVAKDGDDLEETSNDAGDSDDNNKRRGESLADSASPTKRQPRNRTQAKLLPCAHCAKTFSTLHGLKRHQEAHTREKTLPCKTCDKIFGSPSNLRSHEQTHAAEKTFQCKVCDKIFGSRNDLRSHEQTHTAEKTFPCKMCDKIFGSVNSLRSHEKTHAAEKTFQCKVCDKSFRQARQLSVHIGVHALKPFPCQHCDKSFRESGCLKRHLFVHDVKKAFQCKQCKKSFRQMTNLELHQRRVHAGENGFKADLPTKHKGKKHK